VPDGFAGRVREIISASGNLCVGIDPHASLLQSWGLADDAAGARDFGMRVVDAAAGRVGFVKPQVAFFERHGAEGYSALEQVISTARSAGLLVIADAKRGDIGTTVDAYGEAWLSPGSPLEADAVTTVAYQGLGSLAGVIVLAEASGKGVFVLAATSNPEAALPQQARRADGRTVAAGVVSDILATGSRALGAVMGATVRAADFGIDLEQLAGLPVLAPGFGAQGARLADLGARFGPASSMTLAHVSRSVLGDGPGELGAAMERAKAEVVA
jgi:orotidine-5'-phosphate decarboxylase